jgi:hypothetical protein
MEVDKTLDFSKVLEFKTINGLSGKASVGTYSGSKRMLSEEGQNEPN